MLKSRFILFSIALSAFALWFVLQQTSQKDVASTSTLQSTNYSWQIFNSTSWQFDKQLNEAGPIIQTKTLFYDESAKKSDFTEPRIISAKSDQTLFIKSQTGQSMNDSDIKLNGDVVMIQFEKPISQLEQTQQNKTLKTEYITYNSTTEKISSDQRVEITQASSLMTGTGLEVDVKNNRYQLLSDVEGEYRPTQNAN